MDFSNRWDEIVDLLFKYTIFAIDLDKKASRA